MKNTINNCCGQGTAQTLDDVLDFFGGANRFKDDLLHVANGLVRDLNGSDVNKAMAKMLKENPLFELSKLLERLEVLAKDVAGVKVSNNVANDMLQNIPGLYDALKECTTPVDYKATLDEYTPKIMARLQINAKLNEFNDKSVEILKKQFQEITGLDPEKQIPQRTLSVFKDKDVVGLLFDISKGKVTVNTAEDVEKAFVKLAKDFVEQRQKLADEFCEQLKGFQLPDWVRTHLRQSALVVANIKEFNMSGVKSAVEFDLKPLKTAISAKTFNLKDVSANMVDIMRKIYDAGIKCVGAGTWQALGIEGQFEFAKIMIKCALANDKDLIATLNAHVDEIVAEVQRYVDTLPNDDAYYADKQIRSINNGFNFAVKELASDMP